MPTRTTAAYFTQLRTAQNVLQSLARNIIFQSVAKRERMKYRRTSSIEMEAYLDVGRRSRWPWPGCIRGWSRQDGLAGRGVWWCYRVVFGCRCMPFRVMNSVLMFARSTETVLRRALLSDPGGAHAELLTPHASRNRGSLST
jgi:hypothetical protein